MKPTGLEGRYHSMVHQGALNKIFAFCDSRHDIAFPPAERLLVPLRSNTTAQVLKHGSLHELAVRGIMIELANWHLTISAAASQLIQTETPIAATFGLVDCIPSSVVRESGLKLKKLRSSKLLPNRLGTPDLLPSGAVTPEISAPQDDRYPDHAVAVIGMACKFPGADSLDEFWELLTAGRSMVEEMPEERFSTKGLRRTRDGKLKFWGNFVRDIDAFDHRFFKKSSREAATMDPQQRLLLEVAYQAIESSGYFGDMSGSMADDIGCYLGVCANDYNDNVASHPPNAFSSLGTLRAFLSGKISHYFGWTGPSVTYDTACSSSAVAIHSACKAIQTGECSQALAGGVSLYTNPNFYQNLAAASFLSPTGACKPFDAGADGYCRGEGVGLVVLKKLSAAIANNDNVIGVIAGSAVNQNANSTYITVPHSGSQVSLYRKISSLAGIDPLNVSYCEAHGTGTPVGDPIELASIREVFAGPHRTQPLQVASVKGNIGHLEGASGAAALIKTLLMMQHNTMPVQASFKSLNPKIPALAPDRMEIPVSTRAWDTAFQVACINNYGAAGSNAAMIVCQPPKSTSYFHSADLQASKKSRVPIFIAAHSQESLQAYGIALQKKLMSLKDSEDILPSLAFNLAHKQNRDLPYSFATTASDLTELRSQISTKMTMLSSDNTKSKPVILCFGGQVNNAVGLSRDVFNSTTLLRAHLDTCDATLNAMGLPGLYPEIFQTTPVEGTVKLHCLLFSLQYSCAKAWIDSGLSVDAVVGHSFGQLTALCVSGVLSLQDGLKLVSGRASLMENSWGPERGSMISIEADLSTVLNYVSSISSTDTRQRIEIACYNGPKSHVLVGTQDAIDRLQNELPRTSVRHKRLNVTHGFHSVFTEPILEGLTRVAEELKYNKPSIAIETCTKDRSLAEFHAGRIAEHTRLPVYFGEAVARLAQSLGPCTWLEAGSNSSITAMASRAVGSSNASLHSFHAVQLGTSDAMGSLAETTVNLWKRGLKVQFWPYHRSQKDEYRAMNLPPYQFEKTRHWLSWIDTAQIPAPVEVKTPAAKVEHVLLSLTSSTSGEAIFGVDPCSEDYKFYVQGHRVLAEPLCPAPLYVELVSRAALMMIPESGTLTYLPSIEELGISAPLGMSADRAISLRLRKTDERLPTWTFELASKSATDAKGNPSTHATGKVTLHQDSPKLHTDFSRYQRLIGYHKFDELKSDPDSEIMQGSSVYKAFSRVVLYDDHYKGVRSVYGKGDQVAGIVTLPATKQTSSQIHITKPLAVDNFVQVAGLHVNCLNECKDTEVYVCTKIERIQPGPKFKDSKSWVVYSSFTTIGEKELSNDIFVFDRESKSLVLIVLGAYFTRVLITSLTRVLSRANKSEKQGEQNRLIALPETIMSKQSPVVLPSLQVATPSKPARRPKQKRLEDETSTIDLDIRKLLHRVTDVPMEDFKDDSTLEDLGVDSLMITEVMSEVCKFFELEISAADFANLLDVKSLRNYLVGRGCGASAKDSVSDSGSESGEPSESVTPATSAGSSVVDLTSLQSDLETDLAKLVAGHLESDKPMASETNLANEGLDSLLCIELAADVQKMFGATVDMSLLDGDSTFGDLFRMVSAQCQPTVSIVKAKVASTIPAPTPTVEITSVDSPTLPKKEPASLVGAQQAFEDIRFNYDIFTKQTGFADFWKTVYPVQARLVLAYTMEAFATLGCRLVSMKPGQRLPGVQFEPKHHHLMNQLHNVLKDALLVEGDGVNLTRTSKPVDETHSSTILREILHAFPQHASEHKLLDVTGSKLAECLTGAADPLALLFRSRENKALLEDVYTNGPMYEAITKLLGSFFEKAYATKTNGGIFNILELGGGTGGTTKYIVDFLHKQGIPFTYTFTDLSGSLVTAAKKKFAGKDFMQYMTLDIEKEPPQNLHGKFHTIISTNCIHATRNLEISTTNIRKMLRPDGFVSLVEFTRNMFWFDLVFGLLEGWWLYEDGREHVLADEKFWDRSMRTAGFKHVTWTDGSSEEARTLRIITGFVAEPSVGIASPMEIVPSMEVAKPKRLARKPLIQTISYMQVGKTTLHADIYVPSNIIPGRKRPIGMSNFTITQCKANISQRYSSMAVVMLCSLGKKSTSNKSNFSSMTDSSQSA